MDQSKSNSSEKSKVSVPRRNFSLEFFVGLFTMAGVAAAGYLAVGLGDLRIGASNEYTIFAEFDNISGLKNGASVEIAGVQVGRVVALRLNDPMARLEIELDNSIRIRDDDIASIRTKGIIGDRYVKISRGASEVHIGPGETMIETESVVDIEDIIGKIVHSLGGDDDDDDVDEIKVEVEG